MNRLIKHRAKPSIQHVAVVEVVSKPCSPSVAGAKSSCPGFQRTGAGYRFAPATLHGVLKPLLVCFLLMAAAQADRLAADEGASAQPAVKSTLTLKRLTTDGYFKQRPTWSPDGKWLAFARHRGSTIYQYLRAADGSAERRLTKRNDPEFDAVFSPDGKRLLFALVKTSPGQGNLQIYSVLPNGEDLQPVVVDAGKLSHEEWPAWSTDGKQIAYTSTRDGNQELYVARADGKKPKRLTSHPAVDAHPTFSPDGKQIVFATDRWGDLELAVVEVESGEIARLTESPGLDDYPSWSPDGKQLAFTSNRDGNFEIYVVQADGSNPQNMTQHRAIDNFPTWTPDGRLTFVSNRNQGFDIYVSVPAKP